MAIMVSAVPSFDACSTFIYQMLSLDFAVGAPYDDNGAGAVYIYFGQEDWKTDFKFIKLTGKSNDIGFGHSITGNVDADGNDTPGILYKSI